MDFDQKSSSTSREGESIDDYEITGLRSKRLVAMIVCLIILFILTALILIMNIMIITTLRMNPTGIKFLRFHQNYNKTTQSYEKTVEMTGEKIEFDKVATEKVFGFLSKDINVIAPRVLVSSKANDSLLEMTHQYCRFKNINNFQVLSRENGKTMFSARHPTVSIDRKIKQISADKIVTNKIRSAVDEELKINGENVIIHGDQQVRIDAMNVAIDTKTRAVFNSTAELHLNGKIRIGNGGNDRIPLPLSTSPQLSASLAGLRLCACIQHHHKLFLVPSNKDCNAQDKFCNVN